MKYRDNGPLFGNFDESDNRYSFGVNSIVETPAVDPITVSEPVAQTATVFKSPTIQPSRRDMSLRRKALSLKGNTSSPDLTFVSF